MKKVVSFSLSDDQVEQADKFKREHECKYRNKDVGAIGGKTTYRFTPTSLGVVVFVSCVCGEEMDLSNYEDW